MILVCFLIPLNDSSTLRAYPPTRLRAPAMPAPPNTRDATLSFLPTWAMGPKGIKWDPRDPRGTQGPPRGGDGPMGLFGVIPKPFRMASYSEASPNGKAEWMALPNAKLCHVFTQPRKRRTECRRIWLDFDGFVWIWMDLIDFIENKMIPKLTI